MSISLEQLMPRTFRSPEDDDVYVDDPHADGDLPTGDEVNGGATDETID